VVVSEGAGDVVDTPPEDSRRDSRGVVEMEFWTDFWDIIWWFVWAFAFIAYLFALFSIVGDLFRDRELSGWWKAVWLVFLVVLPFVTALVYLIARGRGMAERSVRAATTARAAGEEYIRDVAGATPGQQIAQAKILLDDGAIDRAEFESLKAHALAQARGTSSVGSDGTGVHRATATA
jgi:hypothetical protein